MRLVHWIQTPPSPDARSGMLSTVVELVEAEMEVLGVRNVAACDVINNKGGNQINMRRRVLVTQPWDENLNDPDAVHLIHTWSPMSIYDMKRKVLIAHGVPDYCWLEDVVNHVSNWWQITTLVRLCDATVSWFDRDVRFWEELGGGRAYSVRRGVDLRHWTPLGDTETYRMHPHVLYAEAMRIVKQPFSLLFAIKKVQKQVKNAHLRLIISDDTMQLAYSNLITRLGVEHLVPVIFGMLPDPRPMFRGSDICVSPTMWGLVPRVPIEMMACGKPAICFKGTDESPIYGARVEDDPEDIASAILRIWEKIQSDPEGEKLRARKVAERSYDIRDTARNIVKICEGVM